MSMKKYTLYSIIGLISLGIAAFAYYTISPLFRTVVVDERAPAAGVLIGKRANVIGTAGHPASGSVSIVETPDMKYVRYENLKTINGPDLYIYLAKDLEAKEYVNLGLLRATEGNVNYEIPDTVQLAEYRYVMTWCKQFGVLFNYADISDANE